MLPDDRRVPPLRLFRIQHSRFTLPPMPIKKYNPTSPGRRAGSVIDYKAVITKTKPEKSLTEGKRRAHGRNHHGIITAKHRGGGNKKLYRIIDFKRNRK